MADGKTKNWNHILTPFLMIQCFHQRVITGVPRFFPKIELPRTENALPRGVSVLGLGGIRNTEGGDERRDERWGQGGDSKNGVADRRHTVTPGPISRGHFSPEGERRRQPKITPHGPPSRPAADQSPGHGLIESRQSPLVGLIAPHHFRTSERSTSLLRDFYPDALARRAVPRHVLNWRV